MKVKASINRLTGAQNNIKNAMGFLEVQDGLLETAGKIVMRMSELKGYATQDPLKSESDIASYNNEFKDLQYQLFQISEMDFNGTSLFANYAADSSTGSASTTEAKFGGKDQDPLKDFTLDIFTSSEGSEGTKVSIHKSLLLSALTLRQTDEDFTAEDGEAAVVQIRDIGPRRKMNFSTQQEKIKYDNGKQPMVPLPPVKVYHPGS